MSSSTALLPKNPKKDDHPIFLRVCHSPWISINQRLLVAGRGFIATYMSIVFTMLVYRDVKKAEHGWLIPFELPNIIYLLQVIYAWTTFSWTFKHLHYPHHGSVASSPATRLQAFFSPPRQHHSTKNRAIFSIFYTAVVVFPHVVTLVYWLILLPHEQTSPEDLLGYGWFRSFCIINKYGVNNFIALVEIVILSSIKRQEPIWAHVVGLSMLCGVYVGWAYIGKTITGICVYFFFDLQEIGWENVLVSVISFVGLTNTFFAVTYGITGIRELLTKKSENTSAGYIRLPQ